ncbi:hypothetical protein R6Z07F_011256 [Ovis aries]
MALSSSQREDHFHWESFCGDGVWVTVTHGTQSRVEFRPGETSRPVFTAPGAGGRQASGGPVIQCGRLPIRLLHSPEAEESLALSLLPSVPPIIPASPALPGPWNPSHVCWLRLASTGADVPWPAGEPPEASHVAKIAAPSEPEGWSQKWPQPASFLAEAWGGAALAARHVLQLQGTTLPALPSFPLYLLSASPVRISPSALAGQTALPLVEEGRCSWLVKDSSWKLVTPETKSPLSGRRLLLCWDPGPTCLHHASRKASCFPCPDSGKIPNSIDSCKNRGGSAAMRSPRNPGAPGEGAQGPGACSVEERSEESGSCAWHVRIPGSASSGSTWSPQALHKYQILRLGSLQQRPAGPPASMLVLSPPTPHAAATAMFRKCPLAAGLSISRTRVQEAHLGRCCLGWL